MGILLLIGGLLLVLMGANCLMDGVMSITKRFHVPSIVIGLTIVASGTPVPELTVSVSSALKGSVDIVVGNVVGDNIFDTLMIVGCTALFAPIAVTRNTLRKEIPLCILPPIALLICTNGVSLDKAPHNALSISNGLILLHFFTIFLGHIFTVVSCNTNDAQPPEEEIKSLPMWRFVLFILGRLGGLTFGGQWFVEGASNIARNLSVSESVIGPTLVVGGTSLPELIISIVAASKKNPEIAIGNVIDSNLFNIPFMLGCNASITPLQLAGINSFDLLTLVGPSILLWSLGLFFAKHAVTRVERNILVLRYIAHTVYLIYQIRKH